MQQVIRLSLIFFLSFNILSSNDNVVKTSELELVLFKMAYESLLKDVKRSKQSASLNENDLKNINVKIEMIMNELFKDKRVLVKDIDETSENFDMQKIKQFQEEIALLKEDLSLIKQKRRSVTKEAKTVEVKEETIKEPTIIVKNNFKQLYNTKKFHALKCFDYEQGSTTLSNWCKEKIVTFIDKNKKALRFELIPIMSENDNTLYSQMEVLLDDIGTHTSQKIDKYLIESLSRDRVINALEYINTIDNEVLVTTANYYVESRNLKGIVFRAYYTTKN